MEKPVNSETMKEKSIEQNTERIEEERKEEGYEKRESTVKSEAEDSTPTKLKPTLGKELMEEDENAIPEHVEVRKADGPAKGKQELIIEEDDDDENFRVLPSMSFCPTCANLLQEHNDSVTDKFWLRCPTCPYQYEIYKPFVLAKSHLPPRVVRADDSEDSEESEETCLDCGIGKLHSQKDSPGTYYGCDNEDCCEYLPSKD